MDKYLEFTIKAFKYLNGRINKFNLNIELVISYDLPTYAMLQYRSLIFINLEKILSKNRPNDNARFLDILFVLTHELFHADQLIDPELFINNDKNYQLRKEKEVDYRTVYFISSNKKEIEEMLGVYIDDTWLYEIKKSIDQSIGINNIADYERMTFEQCFVTNMQYLVRIDESKFHKDNIALDVHIQQSTELHILKLDGVYKTDAIYTVQSLIRMLRYQINDIIVFIEETERDLIIQLYLNKPLIGIIEE